MPTSAHLTNVTAGSLGDTQLLWKLEFLEKYFGPVGFFWEGYMENIL